jgi:hypothetical protein
MLRQRPRILAAAVLLSACFSTVSAAPTGRIFGRITDPSKAVVPGASVTALNEATQSEQSAMTDESGNFLFSNVPVGV